MSIEIDHINTLPSTITGRVRSGLAATILNQVILAANSILLVPLFLRAWGSSGYGNWLTLTAFISYLSLLDLGGQNFIGNLLTREYVRGGKNDFQQILSEGVSLFTMIALIGFFLLVIVLSLPWLSLPGQNLPLSIDERFILLLMGASLLLSIPAGVYVTTYRATGLFVRGTMIGNILRIFFLVFFIIILISGFPPTIYAASYLISGIAGTLVIVWDTRRQVPNCRRIQLNLAAARAGYIHLSGSFHFWLLKIADIFNQQGVILVLAANISPAAVAVYVTHRTVSGLVGYIGSLLQAPLWPELTFLHAQNNKEKLMRMPLLAIRSTVLLSGIMAIGLWVLLPKIYPAWTRRQLQLQPILLSLFLIQAVLAAGWTTSGWSLLAASKHHKMAYWSLLNAVLTLTLSIILAPKFGILGVAFATLLGDIMCGAAIYPVLSSRFLKVPVRKLYESMLFPVAVLVIPAALFITIFSFMQGWKLIINSILLGVVLIYPILYFVFGKYELSWLIDRFNLSGGKRA